MSKREDHIRRAAAAHTNLNVFGAVISILEGGALYGGRDVFGPAEAIIRICKREQQKWLRKYDEAMAKARQQLTHAERTNMAEQLTESRVLMNREKDNNFLREWCSRAAERGGRFEVKQEWYAGGWTTLYRIWWPANVEVPAELKSAS